MDLKNILYNIFYDPFALNKPLFILLNKAAATGYTPYILKYLSDAFTISYFPFYYASICIYLYIKARSLPESRQYFSRHFDSLLKLGISYTFFGFIFAALKFSVNLPRPFCSLSAAEFATIADISGERCFSSFPGAHAGLSLLIVYFLAPHLKTIFKLAILCIVPAVALARISLAMHYPSDIIYGIFLSGVVILLAENVYRKLQTPLLLKAKTNFLQLLFK